MAGVSEGKKLMVRKLLPYKNREGGRKDNQTLRETN